MIVNGIDVSKFDDPYYLPDNILRRGENPENFGYILQDQGDGYMDWKPHPARQEMMMFQSDKAAQQLGMGFDEWQEMANQMQVGFDPATGSWGGDALALTNPRWQEYQRLTNAAKPGMGADLMRVAGILSPALLAGAGALFGGGAAAGTAPVAGLENMLVAPTGTGQIAGALGGIGDVTTLLETGGLLGGSSSAIPLGGAAATGGAAGLGSLFGGDQMINNLLNAPTATGVTQVPGIPAGGVENILQGGAGVPVSGPLGTVGGAAGAAGAGAAGAGGSAASTLSKFLKDNLGIDVDASTLGMLGTGLSTVLGAYASNKQSDALTDIANQARGDRLPALNAFNSALSNPDTWYSSAPAMGATDSVLRKLSAQVGNPAMNPGAISQAAAYNLGGYNDYLRTMGNLGLSGQDTTIKAQTNAALGDTNFYNAIGSGIGSLTSNQPDMSQILSKLMQSKFGLS